MSLIPRILSICVGWRVSLREKCAAHLASSSHYLVYCTRKNGAGAGFSVVHFICDQRDQKTMRVVTVDIVVGAKARWRLRPRCAFTWRSWCERWISSTGNSSPSLFAVAPLPSGPRVAPSRSWTSPRASPPTRKVLENHGRPTAGRRRVT